MTKYFICCEKCFEVVGKKSTKAARLWMELCAFQMNSGEIMCLSNCDWNEFDELFILESLGYLVSTETEEDVSFKLNGHLKTEDDEHFFCVKEGIHV